MSDRPTLTTNEHVILSAAANLLTEKGEALTERFDVLGSHEGFAGTVALHAAEEIRYALRAFASAGLIAPIAGPLLAKLYGVEPSPTGGGGDVA